MYTLITAATSAKAQQLKSKLNTANIILGDYLAMPAFMLKADLIKLPGPTSASYAHEMLTLCLNKEIDIVYPLGDNELSLLTEAEQLFKEYGIVIVHGS
jgi:hypothetical protein